MTVNAYVVTKIRDVLVAEQVGKKAALGYFDVEFTLYGCAYYTPKDDTVRYKISSKAIDIYTFIEYAQRQDIFASNVETISIKCPVPLGEKETIEIRVKYQLAKQLKEKYPKSFFIQLNTVAEQIRNNSAAHLLWELADEIEGHFEEKQLQQFEDLLHYAYSCLKLTHKDYQNLLKWLQEEYDNMLDSVVCKDIYEKTMYGIAYKENDVIKYIANAQLDYIFNKIEILEQQGKTISPIFTKQYFYNYQFRLPDVVKLFKQELRDRYTKSYMEELRKLRSAGYSLEEIIEMGKVECHSKACEKTLKRYATHWASQK